LAKTEEKPTTKPKVREGCTYRVFGPLCIRASGQWIPAKRSKPLIADLSDCTDESIRILLEKGYIETADGKPFNKPTGAANRPPCPCAKKE
jgi:hypothetical protein